MSTLSEQLQSAGYRIVLEQRAWWHCLIDEDGASWSGEGADAERATRAAFQRMVPSRTARECLLGFLETRERAREREAAPREAAHAPETVELCGPPPPIAVIEAAEVVAEVAGTSHVEIPLEALAEPRPEPLLERDSALGADELTLRIDDAASVEACPASPPTDTALEATLATSPATLDAHSTAALRPSQPDQLEIDVAFQILGELEEEMHAAAEDVGQLAPSFMRLMFLHWIARARACEDASDHQPGVKEAVHRVALRLSSWAKSFWPGSVDALQYESAPEDSWPLLGKSAQAQPRTWTAVAECAPKEIQLLGDELRLDEDGWRDAQALQPQHHNPEAVLSEVGARLKKLVGGIDDNSIQKRRRLAANAATGKELVDMAKRMRWIRGAVENTVAWADGMGLLRRIAWDADRELPELKDVLNENWFPNHGTWAAACGQDPKKKAKQRLKKEFHASRPAPGCTEKELQAWVARGLDVLTAPELLVHVEAFAERISAWNDSWLRVRGQRTRLRKVQQLLCGPRDGDPTEALEVATEEGDEQTEKLSESGLDAAVEELRRRVLPFTSGKQVLLVSNRNDQTLAELLRVRLEAVEVELAAIDERRVHAAAERIRNGSHELVLCATGFMSHGAEGVIRDACARGSIPCVRVGKGRLATVLRCLHRAFNGLEENAAVG